MLIIEEKQWTTGARLRIFYGCEITDNIVNGIQLPIRGILQTLSEPAYLNDLFRLFGHLATVVDREPHAIRFWDSPRHAIEIHAHDWRLWRETPPGFVGHD